MDDTLKETLRLVFSSTRSMPAHFTSNGERKQSFCIEFEPLSADVDFNMASESWGSVDGFLNINNQGDEILSKSQFNTIVRCGEDIMVGAFILTKLNGTSLMDKMKQAIIDDTVETFGEKISDLPNIISGRQVNKYFDYCIEYGQTQAN